MNLEKVHEQARGDPAAFVKSEAASRLPLSKRTVVEAKAVQEEKGGNIVQKQRVLV